MVIRLKGNQFLIALTLFAGLIAFFTVIGLINALLVDLSVEFNTRVAVIGQLTTTTAMSWAFFAFILGPFSDRLGHNRMVVLGLLVFGMALTGFGLSQSLLMLIISSLFIGLSGAIVGPNILACIGDFYKPKYYGRVMSVVTAATPMANVVGVPLTVLIAGNMGWRWSFFILALFTLIGIFLAVTILPTTTPQRPVRGITYTASFMEAFRSKTFLPIILANTALQATFWIITTYFAAFLIMLYKLDSRRLALFLSLMAVGQLVGVLIGGSLADRLNRVLICAVFSTLLGIVGIVFILYTPHVMFSVSWGGLFMGVYAAGRPAFFSLMVMVSKTVRGTVMGVQATSNHLGRALGAAIGGLAIGFADYNYLGFLCLFLGLITSSLYIYVAVYLRNPEKL